jgi:replicative DNA helicase
LDNLLNGGFNKSDLIILAARPSMGKTAFALAIAANAARNNFRVAFFSIEMESRQLMQRLIDAHELINTQSILLKNATNEMVKVAKGIGELSVLPIFFDDSSALSIMEMRAKCRRMKIEQDIQLIIVDYLQLIRPTKAESREREIAIISSTLKQIARELEVPVLALAQLNRGVETRTGKDKVPMLADLRESGSIEQDADVVMFIHRPEYYERNEIEIEKNNWKNLAQIIIGKHRNGAIGSVDLTFLKEFGRFDKRALNNDLSPNYNTMNKMPENNHHSQIIDKEISVGISNDVEQDIPF